MKLAAVFAVALATSPTPAQDATVERQAEALRAQLQEVTDRQAQLQAREQQLDEAMKPENIEHSLAGVGTTDASALRDQRRQQLEREKASVEEQLQGLASSRLRLEASIASAEAEAVRLRAASLNTNPAPQRTGTAAAPVLHTTSAKPNVRRTVGRRHKTRHRRR